jgi:hypothetical protein
VALAYDCQFNGSFSHFRAASIWKAITEPKCKFYAWIVFHNWVLTADNMLKKNWACNQMCALCLCSQESTDHLLTRCNYTEAVWNLLAGHFNLPSFNQISLSGGPVQWSEYLSASGSKKEKREKLGILFYFSWAI